VSVPHEAARAIRDRAGEVAPRVGLILGSGSSDIAALIGGPVAIDYADLPGFPRPSVEGHAGRLLLGTLGGAPVACLQGRAHAYEGVGIDVMAVAVRTLKLLGCAVLVLTNAAGSLRAEAGPGNLMLIADHINMLPGNPLAGSNDARFGPRFPDMSAVYDEDLRARLRAAAAMIGVELHEGVYLATLGPNFETPAEIRAFRALGADAVGMSTVPEAIVARHCGLRVAALSILTNLAAGMDDAPLSHEQTLEVASRAGHDLGRLIAAFLEGYARLAP
jgi:xanthosine phosphorylase